MIGQFLEISVQARDIAASADFWQRAGLRHAVVGDTWPHRYAVLTDGRLVIGLHDYEFDSPSLTFVKPAVADSVPALKALGVAFDFEKTGTEQFNEAGFRDPAGQVVTLLEARTYSPPWQDGPPGGLFGHFVAYAWPAADVTATIGFWEQLGLVVDRDIRPQRIVAGGITLAPGAASGGPTLLFRCPDAEAAAAVLAARGLDARPDPAGGLLLDGPDGMRVRLEPR